MKITIAAIATLVSAAVAQQAGTFSVNTPTGAVTTCSNIFITWTKGNAAASTTEIDVIDNASGNVIPIGVGVSLAAQTYTWKVNVTAGAYHIQFNDGQDNAINSGTFNVANGQDTSCVGAAASGGSSGSSSAAASSTPAGSSSAAPSSSSAPTSSGASSSGSSSASSTGSSTSSSPKASSSSSSSGAGKFVVPAAAGVLAMAAAFIF